MIGARPALLAGVAIVATAVALGQRAADPRDADRPRLAAARAAAVERAGAAIVALDRLDVELREAIAAGRRGSAAIVGGEQLPGADLLAAADATRRASDTATSAMLAVDRARRAAAAAGIAIPPPDLPAADELVAIGDQLGRTAEPADTFVARRLAAVGVLEDFDRALARLDAGAPADAIAVLDGIGGRIAEVEEWGLVNRAVLAVWIATVRDMAAALTDLAAAVEAGDQVGAAEAGDAFAAASANAREADLALQIAIAEGGGAVAATPMQRLADALARVQAARVRLVPILHATSPAP